MHGGKPMRGFYGYGMGYNFPWWNIVSWVIGIGVIAAIIFFAVRSGKQKTPEIRADKGDALQILADRLARGEITKEEYLETKELLDR